MKKAIEKYYAQLKNQPDYYKYEDFSDVSREIYEYFNNGITPVEKKQKTDVSCFKKEYECRC